jgi:Fuc2NAc and GlcNAc transferase
MTIPVWCIPVAAVVVAWLLTGLLRQYALRRQMIDVPGQRSSHHAPTPRGGGAAVAIATSLGLLWLVLAGRVDTVAVAATAGAALVVALIGFIDDHGHVQPGLRLAGHFVSASVAVWALGGLPPLELFGVTVAGGWVGHVLAVLFVVWMLNLSNFMDGIDGLAATQVITVCAAGAVFNAVLIAGGSHWIEPVILGSATAGFLIWNWPPARIFLGDVGSGYLGFMIAIFTLNAAWAAPPLGWAWLGLSAVFVTDATVTLLFRAVRRARLAEPHRSHAYQHLARAWASHRRVTLSVLIVNVCVLAPVSWLIASGRVSPEAGLVLIYGPLVAVAAWLGAGRP